ncbi:MAG: hypothetical protein WC241_04620 [Candidatus Paceibacterota bacterium]
MKNYPNDVFLKEKDKLTYDKLCKKVNRARLKGDKEKATYSFSRTLPSDARAHTTL